MVGLVLVSHSEKLCAGVEDLTKIMADGCPIACAGGCENGEYGTSYQRILEAIESVHTKDGVLLLADMGSAVMTAEMVIEDLGYDDVLIADCPIAEGAVAASLASVCGDDLETVYKQALSTKNTSKW